MARLCVGIDLGTTFSVVAVCRKGRVEVIANDSGSRTTPSVVGFLDGESFVGEAAKDLPAEQQIYDAKRLLGRTAGEVQAEARDWPFKVAQQGGVLTVRVAQGAGRALQPAEVSAMVVKSLKESAEMFLAQSVPCAVITVPPYFEERQRQATLRAGELAGLRVLQLLAEPEAAVAAYGLQGKRVLVLHVGGRSVYAWAKPTQQGRQAACKHLDWGGSLFDQRLVDHCVKDIGARHGVRQLDEASLLELRTACEAAKRKLSSMPEASLSVGTTFSVVAVCRKGRVEVIANDSGSRTTPSVVGFLDGESFVGEAAKDLPADNRVFDAKRLIGRPWSDASIQADKKHWPFEVFESRGVPRIKVNVANYKETFAPEEATMVLRSLKETAENFLGAPVSKAVITVPAYFNERQRQATKDAGKIAGLEVLSIINEPTSAAIAYGLDKAKSSLSSPTKKTVFIFDLGGGTFDVSVMTIKGRDFTVLASDGDTHLGGQDFDVRLMEHFMKDIRARHGISQLDKQAVQDLRAACELAKRKLSSVAEASLTLFFSRHSIRFSGSVTRACFEDLCADLFQRTMDITQKVLYEAKVSRDVIDEVVLVGGSTRIPKVRSMLSALFGGKGLRHSINPDEAVAYGAAVHAAVLSGDKFFNNLVKLKDVTPLSLGVDVVGGRFSIVIPKNSPVPCKKTKTYLTVYDYQERVSSKIYQGERPLTKDNHCLDKEYIVEVPPAPAGDSKVKVTFEIDVEGLLTVTCVEPTTFRQMKVQISQKESQRSDQEIQDMIEKSKRFRNEDQNRLKEVERSLRLQGYLM